MRQDAISSVDVSAKVEIILAEHRTEAEDLLPVLHAIQDVVGYIPPESVPSIAKAFNQSRAEVHGVITFYHYFRTTPPAMHTVQICRAESCQSMGADALIEHAQRSLGCNLHGKDSEEHFALEPVYCLGQCATSPAIMIDDRVYAKVTPVRFDQLIAKARGTK